MRAPTAGRDQTGADHHAHPDQAILISCSLPALLAAQATAPLELSLKQAIEMALAPDGNARVRLAQEAVRQAQSRSAQARAALAPQPGRLGGRTEPDAQPGGLRHQDRAAHPRLPVPRRSSGPSAPSTPAPASPRASSISAPSAATRPPGPASRRPATSSDAARDQVARPGRAAVPGGRAGREPGWKPRRPTSSWPSRCCSWPRIRKTPARARASR